MTALPPFPDSLLAAGGGSLPPEATVEEVRYTSSAEFYLKYLAANATVLEKYQVQMWWGKVKDRMELAAKESDRQRADESRRGAYADTDQHGIPRNLKTYSDGAPFANEFGRRWGARAGLNNRPPVELSCYRTAFEPDLYPTLGKVLNVEGIMAALSRFLGPLRAKGGGLLTYCDNRERAVRRWLDQFDVVLRSFDATKWESAKGADELRGFIVHAIEGLREEFSMVAVKMSVMKCLGAQGQDSNRPSLPFYLMSAIEGEEKKREHERKEQIANTKRQRNDRERGARGSQTPRGNVFTLKLDTGRGGSAARGLDSGRGGGRGNDRGGGRGGRGGRGSQRGGRGGYGAKRDREEPENDDIGSP